MARLRMVTRTVVGTRASVMCVNTSSAQVEYHDFEVGGKYDNNELLKVLKKSFETDELKLIQIDAIDYTDEMYGMLETDFIKLAKKLDKETRKMIETEE